MIFDLLCRFLSRRVAIVVMALWLLALLFAATFVAAIQTSAEFRYLDL